MSKLLVAYFSASGVTANVAKKIAEEVKADLYEIRPSVPYTEADLDWRDQNSRSSVEMKDKNSRPAIADQNANILEYDVIFLGFPIWWYTAPTVINTFLESYDFDGKTIILFATSGSTDFGSSVADLKASVSETTIIKEGIVMRANAKPELWKSWLDTLSL